MYPPLSVKFLEHPCKRRAKGHLSFGSGVRIHIDRNGNNTTAVAPQAVHLGLQFPHSAASIFGIR